MWMTQVPAPLLLAGALMLVVLLVLLILITACSPAAARRLIRLLETLQHLVHGTCQHCGRELKASHIGVELRKVSPGAK